MATLQKRYDVFISHASEDKQNFVRPLVEVLSNLGYRVWYDEFTISVGDGLRRAMDQGISNSRYGIVVLSQAFFNKGWTNYELDGLLQYDIGEYEEGTLLPIWLNVTREDVSSYSLSLSNRYAIRTDGNDITAVVSELEKKLGDYYYSVDSENEITRSKKKTHIDVSMREKGFQLISLDISHRLVNTEKSIVTSDSIIYPYEKHFNTLKYNHWQSNIGHVQLIRHLAYDLEQGQLISTNSEVLKNDGSNFISAVKFERRSSGPVRVISEIKTTNLYKSVFEEGSDEVEIYHRLRIEHYSFSLFLPKQEAFSKIEFYINGEHSHFSNVPGGRILEHKISGVESMKTVYSLLNRK